MAAQAFAWFPAVLNKTACSTTRGSGAARSPIAKRLVDFNASSGPSPDPLLPEELMKSIRLSTSVASMKPFPLTS